jgi:hypothetical protein
MKIQLTKTAKQELKVINKRFLDDNDSDYDLLTERESLVCDAGMYVNNAYVDNSFTQLDSWCLNTGKSECDEDYIHDVKGAVKQKIGKMLIEDIITIIE